MWTLIVLYHLNTTAFSHDFTLITPWSLEVCSCLHHFNSLGSIQARLSVGVHCFSLTDIHVLQLPIYTPRWREAIDIKHFAKECNSVTQTGFKP